MDVKISVVIPTYRSSSTIVAALDSVRAQGLAGLDIVVVDDASPDGTVRVVEDWMRRQDGPGGSGKINCRVLVLPVNGGPAAARNRGIAAAAGEWIAFLDGDDAWLPGRLPVQLALATANPEVDLWCGRRVAFEGAHDVLRSAGQPAPGQEAASAGLPIAALQERMRRVPLEEFIEHNVVATSTVLVRKTTLSEMGGFDEQFRGPEDYDLWMRIARDAKIAYIDVPLSQYRSEPGSLSMDDRTFLPEVLRVFAKAFADGGALSSLRDRRDAALSTQLWNASWMAFSRGDRVAAVVYWLRAYGRHLLSSGEPRRRWWPLLYRYCLGSRH